MSKFCTNGHQMEDGWDDCPYCRRTGYRPTVGGGSEKTRLEEAPLPASAALPHAAVQPVAGGRTVLLSTLRKSPVVGWLVAMNGSQKGEDFRLRDGQNVLGSAEGVDVLLHDAAVSAKHASIRYRDGSFTLTDLDSTNGTYLNEGEAPISREMLKDNDLLRLGEIALKFKCL